LEVGEVKINRVASLISGNIGDTPNGETWMFKGESHMVNYKDANEQRQESSIKEWNKNHMVRGEVVAKLRLQASLMTYRQRFKL
jgi:hypothetical protein